jgi:shikimate kinase
MDSGRIVFLVGFMGSGKTAVGRLLAARLGVPFVDLDERVERDAGAPVRSLFEHEGEAAFRVREREALARVCAELRESGGVVATGGGTFIDPANRERIAAAGVSVWLDAPLASVVRRIPRDGSRPLYGQAVEVARLFGERRVHYARATHRVDAGLDDPARVADRAYAVLTAPPEEEIDDEAAGPGPRT